MLGLAMIVKGDGRATAALIAATPIDRTGCLPTARDPQGSKSIGQSRCITSAR